MLADAGTQIRLAADRCEPYLSDLHRPFFLQVLENRHGKNQVIISITLSTFPSPRIIVRAMEKPKAIPTGPQEDCPLTSTMSCIFDRTVIQRSWLGEVSTLACSTCHDTW